MQDERDTAPAGPGRETKAGAGSKTGRTKEFIGEKYSAASDSAKRTYGNVKEKVSEADLGAMFEQARMYVQQNPGKALVASVAAGFLVGLLLRRTDDED